MRVIMLGGTRFIGRATVEELVAAGHEVLVVHRGKWEPPDFPDVTHVHVDRAELGSVKSDLADFGADAAIDCIAMTGTDAEAALAALPDGLRLVVLSSCDVYRAYAAVLSGGVTDPVPIFETSPVRPERQPFEGMDYEKLDVEDAYLGQNATVIRLPMVYGERDGQRREWPILRRVVAGRDRIPFGAGTWVSSKGYVGDMGRGIRLALESEAAAGEIFNLNEAASHSVELWARQILAAAGSKAELVRVPDEVLPPDLGVSGTISQHLLCDASKARRLLGWTEDNPEQSLRRSVEWHLAHPPEGDDPGFDADDAALEQAL